MKLSGKKGTEQSKKKSVGKAKKASEVIKVPGDWLYMTPQEIGVRQIYEAFGEQDAMNWKSGKMPEFLRLECQRELL